MSANTEQVWLTEDTHDRLKRELAALLAQRENGAHERADAMEHEQRELRIRQLHELLRSAIVHEPPDDGVAEPGMVLTLRWDDEDDTETFLMADQEGSTVYRDLVFS